MTSVFELKQQTDLIYNNSIIKCQGYHEAYGLTTELANMSIALKVVVVCKCLKKKKIFINNLIN